MSLPIFSFSTTAEEVTAAYQDQIAGKNVLVTGTALNGIGFETARVLAQHANLIILIDYNQKLLKSAEDAIRNEFPAANLRSIVLDLSSLADVRRAAQELNESLDLLHLTADGLESQVATNHIGPFLLTKLLAPKLLAAKSAKYIPRVVFVSSIGHTFGTGVNFDTLGHPNKEKYVSIEAYYQSKAANVLTAIELSKRSAGKMNAYSVHPGVIYTNIMQHPEAIAPLQKNRILGPDGLPTNERFTFKTIPQGAATTVVAAIDPRLNNKPGAYLEDCVIANEGIFGWCDDPINSAKLWSLTEGIIGEKFVL